MTARISPEQSMRVAFTPMTVPTLTGDVSVTTSSALLFADSVDTSGFYGRRIRVYNTDASATLGLFFIAAGGTATGLLIANSMKIGPGMSVEMVICNNVRVAAVGSASLTANVLVSDPL